MIINLAFPSKTLLCIVVDGESKGIIIFRFTIEALIFAMTLEHNYLIEKFIHNKVKNEKYIFSLLLVMILFCWQQVTAEASPYSVFNMWAEVSTTSRLKQKDFNVKLKPYH